MSALEVLYECPGCGCPERIGEQHIFRMHDHACPLMPADMANIPNEIEGNHHHD